MEKAGDGNLLEQETQHRQAVLAVLEQYHAHWMCQWAQHLINVPRDTLDYNATADLIDAHCDDAGARFDVAYEALCPFGLDALRMPEIWLDTQTPKVITPARNHDDLE